MRGVGAMIYNCLAKKIENYFILSNKLNALSGNSWNCVCLVGIPSKIQPFSHCVPKVHSFRLKSHLVSSSPTETNSAGHTDHTAYNAHLRQ